MSQQHTSKRMSTLLSRHRHGKSLAALAVFATVSAAFTLTNPNRAYNFLNPLALRPPLYVLLYVLKCASLALIDVCVDGVLARRYSSKPLPYRENTGAVGLEKLESIDHFYLAVNSFIEYVFSAHVLAMVLNSPFAAWRFKDLTFLNTAPALYLIFVVDDVFYAPTHKLMHHPTLYPYIHKHHHRQTLPARGYLDAGNEHPIEQVLGLSCLWGALHVVARVTGVHGATILLHFLLYAIMALLNHTPFDVRFSFFGFEYAVRAHEMHHRYPQTNLAQYFMLVDKLMGTYKPYLDGAPPPSTTTTTIPGGDSSEEKKKTR